jgi:hypothetical protein
MRRPPSDAAESVHLKSSHLVFFLLACLTTQASWARAETPGTTKSAPTKTSKDKIEERLQTFDRHDDDLALDRAIELTAALQAKPRASQAAALVVRDKKLQRILSIFNHIDAKRDPRFDPKDLPELTTVPSFESGILPGAAPESVRDPAARAAYEKQIAADDAKAKAYGFQSQLNDAQQRCMEIFESLVTEQYAKSSERDLATVIDSTVRSKDLGASLKARVSAIFADRR